MQLYVSYSLLAFSRSRSLWRSCSCSRARTFTFTFTFALAFTFTFMSFTSFYYILINLKIWLCISFWKLYGSYRKSNNQGWTKIHVSKISLYFFKQVQTPGSALFKMWYKPFQAPNGSPCIYWKPKVHHNQLFYDFITFLKHDQWILITKRPKTRVCMFQNVTSVFALRAGVPRLSHDPGSPG